MLAAFGGNPIRKDLLPYSRHEMTRDDIVATWKALESGWIAGNGNYTKKLEEKLCDYTGYKYCILTMNATVALYSAYKAIFVKGEKVSLPALTFVATANSLVNAGLVPSIQDVERRTLVNEKLDVTVSYSGYPVFSGKVADDAHYIYPNMASFKKNLVSCLSFHPVKHLTTGEGGAVLTDDLSIALHVRSIVNHGRIEGDCVLPGWNFRMPDINAALGLSQLSRMNENLVRKKRIAHTYQKKLSGLPVTLPAWHRVHAYHLYVIQLQNDIDRDEFRNLLKAEGIGTQVHYPPLHTLSLYEREGYSLKNIDSIYPNLVSIPLFSSMTDKDVNDVINALEKVIEACYV